MCEEVTVKYRCGHEEVREPSACFEEPKSFEEKRAVEAAGLKGFRAPLPWCSFEKRYSVESRRLCPDCRKERREDVRKAVDQKDCPPQEWVYHWKDWQSKEGEEERYVRKRAEAELERRWARHNYGGEVW